jgi:hypothetical protein
MASNAPDHSSAITGDDDPAMAHHAPRLLCQSIPLPLEEGIAGKWRKALLAQRSTRPPLGEGMLVSLLQAVA